MSCGSMRLCQPSYLVVCLLIVVLVLSYNYWAASNAKTRQRYDIRLSSLQSSLQGLWQVDSRLKVCVVLYL